MIYTENILFEQLPQELQEIGGTSFTVRHIEVLCCLLNGKDNKVIAHFLSISEHTVAAHCNHMRQRANKFSRQHLIEFVEQSGKTLALKHYYLALKQKFDFKNILKTIQQNFKSKPTLCFWQPCALDEKKTLLLKFLTDHLLLSGFKIHILKNRTLSSVSKENVILACFSSCYHPSVQDKDLNFFLEKLQQGRTEDQTTGLVLLFDKIKAIESFQDIKENDRIEFNDINTYFDNFLMLVAQLIPLSANLTHQIENFKKNTSTFFQEQIITQTFPLQSQHMVKSSQPPSSVSQPFVQHLFQQEVDLWCSGIDTMIQHIKDLHNYNLTYNTLLNKLEGMKKYYTEEDKGRALKLLQLYTLDEHLQEINHYIKKIDVLWADDGIGMRAINSCKEMAYQGRGSILDRLYDEDKISIIKKETSFRESDWNWRMVAQIKNILLKKMEKYKELQGQSHSRVDEFRNMFSNM